MILTFPIFLLYDRQFSLIKDDFDNYQLLSMIKIIGPDKQIIEREVFIENSIHIAQSHYINAVLYNMAGEFSRSLRCCGKCLNILKNFEKEQEKKSVVISLKEKMEGAQGRTCDSV